MKPNKKWDLLEAQIAILLCALLQLLIDDRLSLGSKYIMIGLEVLLAIGIGIVATIQHWFSQKVRQILSIILIAIVTIANISSLILVINALFSTSDIPGKTLILAAVAIFITNIILFALWYWELDSPGFTGLNDPKKTNFLFPQMNLPQDKYKNWQPSFFDYLYLSTTNATAFSPTDTMPLNHIAKGLMGIQALVSLLTLALVAARAINILV